MLTAFTTDDNEFEILNEDGEEEITFRIPRAAVFLTNGFKLLSSLLTLFQCKLALKAVEEKTRSGSWKLIKRTLVLCLGHVMVYISIFIIQMFTIKSLIEQFEEEEVKNGKYTIRHDGNER